MHTEYTLLMSMALDGEAAPDEVRQLEAHLNGCMDCAATWTRWQALDRRFAAVAWAPAPANLAEKVTTRLDKREAQKRRSFWLGSGLLVSWFAVLVVSAVTLGLLAWWGTNHPKEVAALLSALAQLLSGGSRALRGIGTLAGSFGGATAALGFGLLIALTGWLALLWAWVMGRSRRWPGLSVPARK